MSRGFKYARNGNYDKLERFIEKGFDVNLKGTNGITPLMMASALSSLTSNLKTVKLLLDKGANVNAQDNFGLSSLSYASKLSDSSSSLDTIKLLLEYGADINLKDEDSNTPLIYASRYVNTTSSPETVKLLIDNGANIHSKNIFQKTPLMYAAGQGDLETITILLNKRADPFDKDVYAHYAVDFCKTDKCVKIISNRMWEIMNNNDQNLIKLLSQQRAIPKSIWELIVLRRRQQSLCKKLDSSESKDILIAFADMLLIPITKDFTKKELCKIISKQLTSGSKYFRFPETVEEVLESARKLGIDTSQSFDKIIEQIQEKLL